MAVEGAVFSNVARAYQAIDNPSDCRLDCAVLCIINFTFSSARLSHSSIADLSGLFGASVNFVASNHSFLDCVDFTTAQYSNASPTA